MAVTPFSTCFAFLMLTFQKEPSPLLRLIALKTISQKYLSQLRRPYCHWNCIVIGNNSSNNARHNDIYYFIIDRGIMWTGQAMGYPIPDNAII